MLVLALVVLVATSPITVPRAWARLGQRLYPDVTFFGPSAGRLVALTIDDGPDPATTPSILAALDRLDVKATFFVIGERALAAPDLVRAIHARGHEVGHHMWRDRATVRLSANHMARAAKRTSGVLAEVGPVRWLRPGRGWVSKRVLRVARGRGLRVVVGDLPPLDTRLQRPELVAVYLAWMARPGSIVTLHDVGGRGERTVSTLDLLIPRLQARGLAVGPLHRLLSPHDA